MAKIVPARERLLTLIDELLGDLAAPPRFAGHPWPFGGSSGVGWAPYSAHLAQFAVIRDRIGAPTVPTGAASPEGAQLQPEEIEPVVTAIDARPGCRLLVFGCGNDSAFWEATNAAAKRRSSRTIRDGRK